MLSMLPSDTASNAAGVFLSVEEERQLSRQWREHEDHKALAKLVASCRRLVIRIGWEFRNAGPLMEDLIQEGSIGLVIAAQRFDPDRGARLSTYAYYWVYAYMMEHTIRSHGPVRIGAGVQRHIFFNLGRARRALEDAGCVASDTALAETLGVPVEDVRQMLPRLSGHDVELNATRRNAEGRSTENIESVFLVEESTTEDRLAEHAALTLRRKRLQVAIDRLDPRERAIVQARYLGSPPTPLAVLGRKFGVSRERIRQLEVRALNKLRTMCRRDTASQLDKKTG